MKNKTRKLLINLGPLKKGGGQNVALNFIQVLQRNSSHTFEFYFIVCESSLILDLLKKSRWKENLIIVSANPILRILQEMTSIKRFIKDEKIGVVYTYFGFGLFGSNVKQIIGSADSNLYFPEVDFWHTEKPLEKIKRFLVDKYRVYGLKNSSGVIFENKAMYKRASSIFGLKSKTLILPSIDKPKEVTSLNTTFEKKAVKVLMLCGWQRNKNILLIPELAHKLRAIGVNIQFVITVHKDNSSCSDEFFKLVEKWDVNNLIDCIGPVKKSQLPDLYNKIDQVILLSLLESFSNNIIEAWYFKKPLIISDELWSKSICFDAVTYVPRDDVNFIALEIKKLADSSDLVSKLVAKGTKALEQFPDINERLEQELKYIETFYD